MNIVLDLPPKLDKKEWVSIDLELLGAEEGRLHRPTTGKFGCLQFCSTADLDTVYIITTPQQVAPALRQIWDCTWVMQMGKFDITHLRRWAEIPPKDKLWDTYIIERLLYSGYYDTFGLNDMVRRYFSEVLDKSLQKEWQKLEEFTPETKNYDAFLNYAALDAYWEIRVALRQKHQITSKILKVYREVDLPAFWATLDFAGFPINVAAWKELAEKNKQRQKDADDQLEFNPRSHAKAKEYLQKKGFTRLPNVSRETLAKFRKKYPDTEAAKLAEIMEISSIYGKRASTYGLSFIERSVEQEWTIDVVHADWNIVGAETGRYACSSPNLQNIPSRDTSEFRECFIARPEYKLVIVDYKQQEIGIAAYIANDRNMLKIFNSGEDIYTGTYKIIYKVDISKDAPERKLAKAIVLGMDYGMSAPGLAEKAGISLDEAEEVTNKFFKAFPGIARYIAHQEKIKTKVETVLGRPIWLNRYSNQCPRNAINAPIQGTAADMMKLALSEMHKQWAWDIPYGVVATVHDETVLCVPTKISNEVSEFASKISSDVANKMCNKIPMNFRVDVYIGDNWSEKK